MPSARKLTAVPLTIWSARRWMEMNACTSASAAPATTPVRMPQYHAPSLSAPRNAEERPHQHHALEPDVHDAAALREDAAQRGEHEHCGQPEGSRHERGPLHGVVEMLNVACVAPASPPPSRAAPLATAPQPMRRSPRVSAPTPRSAPIAPTTMGTNAVRTATGGRAIQNARMPSAMPTIPTVAQDASRRGCAPLR